MGSCPWGIQGTFAEAWAYRGSGHLPSQGEEQYSEQDGVEAGVDLGDPNPSPDLEVVQSVVEGFVLVEGGCRLVFHVVVTGHVDRQLRHRSQVGAVVDVVKRYAHVEPLLFAYLVLVQSSVVAFADQPKVCEAFSKEPALISVAREQV